VTQAHSRQTGSPAAEIHDRMPVILHEAVHRDWLEPAMKDAAKVAEIIARQAIDNVRHYPVSTRLNSAKTDETIGKLIPPARARGRRAVRVTRAGVSSRRIWPVTGCPLVIRCARNRRYDESCRLRLRSGK
jgi:hypothetical protein